MKIVSTMLLASLVFSVSARASTLIVANKSDDTVDLIDLSTGKSVATVATGNAPHEVETLRDGRIAVVADYGDRPSPGSTLTVIDLDSKKSIRTIDLGEHLRPHGLARIGRDRVAVTTEGSGDLLIVDVGRGEVLAAVPTGQSVSHMVVVTPNGKRAFVANIGSGSVTAIDLEASRKLRDIETDEGAEGIAITPDGSEVWVTNREAGSISVIDVESLQVTETIEAPGFPIRIEFAPDGKSALVSAARSGEIIRFDRFSRKTTARKTLDLSRVSDDARRLFADFGESPVPVGIQFSADGKRAFVAATQSDAIAVIDPVTLEVLDLIRAGREPDGMAWAD